MHVAVEDGRSFVRRSPTQYDIIQASLVDTWAATAAGAYALSENSLYTVEAFDDYLDHLTDRGVLSISRWVFDGLRLISLAQEAGARARMGPRRPPRDHPARQGRHVPAEEDPVHAGGAQTLLDAADNLGFAVLYMPGPPTPTFGDNRDDYARLMLAPDRHAFYAQYPLDVTPTTDDRPFFFHTTKLRNHSFVAPRAAHVRRPRRASGQSRRVGDGRPDGAAGAAGDLVVPDRAVHPRARSPYLARALGPGWLPALAYFACLGGAFMLIEVALLQRFVLLLGHPVYSLTVTLFSLLLGTGLGSVLSRRIGDATLRRSAMLACLAVAVVALLWGSVLPPIVQAGDRLAAHAAHRARRRADDTGGNGHGDPAARRRQAAGRRQPQLVAWAWGMNGALSVLGAILAVFIAMNWGFSVTLLCGAVIYAVAAALVRQLPRQT